MKTHPLLIAVQSWSMPRATLAPRSTYRGPSGRMDGPEETQYAAELAVLRARHADPPPEPTPEIPEERPVETPAGWGEPTNEVRD